MKRSLVMVPLLAALLVSVAGAACPPMAEECPMHPSSVGCGAMTSGEPDGCCPGTAPSESAPVQAQLLRPPQVMADTVKLAVDLQPLSQLSLRDEHYCALVVPADFTSLFCLLLI